MESGSNRTCAAAALGVVGVGGSGGSGAGGRGVVGNGHRHSGNPLKSGIFHYR